MADEISRASCDSCCRREFPAPSIECEQKVGTEGFTGYAPFEDPGGDDDDDLPTIYGTVTEDDNLGEVGISGSLQKYFTDNLVVTITGETLWTATSFDVLGDANYDWETNDFDSDLGSGGSLPGGADCVNYSGSGSSWRFTNEADWPGWTDEGKNPECSPTLHKWWDDYNTATTGSALALQGCPGPFDGADEFYCDLIYEEWKTEELSDPKTKSELLEDAETTRDGEDWATGTCTASNETTWPTLGDLRDWPGCASASMKEDLEASGSATSKSVRYRWEVPSEWSGSYFRVDWDEVFFPDGGASPVVTAKSWEWHAPSDKLGAWSSDMQVPPGETGSVEIRNVRFIGFAGAIPQYHPDFETYEP